MNYLDLQQVKPQGEYPYYTISCSGEYTSWGVQNSEDFLIRDNEVKKLRSEELPVSGYAFL